MLSTFPAFVQYFATCIALIAVSLWLYVKITPYDEISLVRAGHLPVAVSFAGTILGLTIAMASAVVHSVGWMDMLTWSVISLAVQLGMWGICNWLLGKIYIHIVEEKCMADAIIFATANVAIGILQASCLVW